MGKIELVKLLLVKGAGIELKDRCERTPLIHGIFLNYLSDLNLFYFFICSFLEG